MIPKYVFVCDDSHGGESTKIFSVEAPTRADFALVKVGLLTIIRLLDLRSFGSDGKWHEVAHGVPVNSEPFGVGFRPVHTHPNQDEGEHKMKVREKRERTRRGFPPRDKQNPTR